jgi:predicted ATP-binding protein involved in virulence
VRSEVQKDAEWLKALRKEMNIRFIESERLTRLGKQPLHRHTVSERGRPAVIVFSEELANEIQKALAAYGELSQRLDRTFPMRLVQQIHVSTSWSSGEALTQKLVELEKKRAILREVGLLEKEDEKFEYPETKQDLTQQVLPVYLRDTEEKLAVFDEIAAKIETLKGIVNSRFAFKHLEILKGEGFHFSSAVHNGPLRVTHLSSGEQHMLVLLSELLFSVKPHSLVLVDEPEISLHVGWQHQFLEDVQRIASLSSIDILIATHSPQIINNRWSLTVELQPPSEFRR